MHAHYKPDICFIYRTLLCGSVGSLVLETYGWQTVFYLLGKLTLHGHAVKLRRFF